MHKLAERVAQAVDIPLLDILGLRFDPAARRRGG
jgi:aspartate/glutamate racemase